MTASKLHDIIGFFHMAKRLEALAEFYRLNGWEDAATLLEAEAAMFRKAGMPDTFPSDIEEIEQVSKVVELKKEVNFDEISQLKVRLIHVLELEDVLPGERALTVKLANVINPIGSQFPDETPLTALLLKGNGHYEEIVHRDELVSILQQEEPDTDWRKLTLRSPYPYVLDTQIVNKFNRGLSILKRRGYETIGEVRYTSKLSSVKGIGMGTLDFFLTAFRKPSKVNNTPVTPRRGN